jgi:hypothetical protein
MTSDHPVKRRKKLIEVAIPLEAGKEPPGQSGQADARIQYSEGSPRNVIVKLADQEIAKIRHLTGESRKVPVIPRLTEEALQQRSRAEIAQSFLTDEWKLRLVTDETARGGEHLWEEETAT